MAVAPIDDPQFLCLVCLDEPHSWTTAGGSLSAPVCAEVLEQTLVYRACPAPRKPRLPPQQRPPPTSPLTATVLTGLKTGSKKDRRSVLKCLFSVLMRLLAELDLAGLAVHGFHNGKALQLDALAADELAALLEALLHGNANASTVAPASLARSSRPIRHSRLPGSHR